MTLWLAWAETTGRPLDLGAAVGAHVALVWPRSSLVARVRLVRYLYSFAASAVVIAQLRPDVIVVMNPPVVAVLPALAWKAFRRCRVVLDSHPSGFGDQGDGVSRRLQWLHAIAVRRAEAVLVAHPAYEERVREWDGRGVVVHEPPPRMSPRLDHPKRGRLVLVASTFARDEPVDVVFEVARALPELDFLVTGRADRHARRLDAVPPNVRLPGFVPLADYYDLLVRASVALVVSTEPLSVMRAAYEATYLQVPLVVSESPATKQFFPFAAHSPLDVAALADAVMRTIESPPPEVVRECAAAHATAVYEAQLAELRQILGKA